MKVCFLSSMHDPYDKRVHHKEARALVKAGYTVLHIAPGDGKTFTLDGVTVITYTGKRSLWGRIAQMGKLYRMARAEKADVYHCNEVESWLVGVCIRLTHKCKVLFDVHEIYSHNLAQSRFPKPLQPIVVFVLKAFYRLLLPFTDHLVLAKNSAKLDFKGVKKPMTLARNYAEITGVDVTPPTLKTPEKITVLHLGAINRKRGWPQLLDAMTKTENKNIHLRILGKFGDNSKDAFWHRAQELGLQDRITTDDWIPYEQVMEEVATADIGIIVFQPVMMNFIHALPHKLFDYMLGGLPVIVPSYAVEVADIVNESHCGLLINAEHPEEIAKALDTLATDAEKRRDMGAKGQNAVLEKYNWEAEAENLITLYRSLEAA